MVQYKRTMPLILSQKTTEFQNLRKNKKRVLDSMRSFRRQQWGILGNERKFDPVDDALIKRDILSLLSVK
jgi:hypothetical protein